jgi:hypothetical protein
MKSVLFAFALLFAAGSATAQTRPPRLVADASYEARGEGPNWQLAIGQRIALRLDRDEAREESMTVLQYFPRVVSHTTEGVRRWQSRTPGGATIMIEARREPCTLGPDRYRDTVTVVTAERHLGGCGGPRLRDR